ncbi:MAG: hypothetical protein K9N55_11215 [Phycisphaerae bacterium]|nr:hypothetical protein [Phycisphaerae bacterium]
MLIDRMTQLDKSSRLAVYAACLVVCIVALYGAIVSPHLQYLQAVQNYEPAIDKMIEKQVDISNTLVGRKKVLEDVRQQFDVIGFTVFSAEQKKVFLASLETLAEEFTCSIAKMDSSSDKSQIVIGEISDPTYVQSVETTLSVLGEYNQLALFMDALQHQDHQVWLTSVDIEMMNNQERVLKCDITIKLLVLQEKKKEVVL